MTILVDTREQKPLVFSHPFVESSERVTLQVGDYSVRFKDGYRPNVIFERKAIGDLFGSVGGKGYPRFKKEFLKAKSKEVELILIIEGTLSRVFKGYEHSTIRGASMVAKLFTLWVRYGLKVVFCKDAEEMAEFITQFFLALGREHILAQK